MMSFQIFVEGDNQSCSNSKRMTHFVMKPGCSVDCNVVRTTGEQASDMHRDADPKQQRKSSSSGVALCWTTRSMQAGGSVRKPS